jgi:response regulator of citrate/malate metabolism
MDDKQMIRTCFRTQCEGYLIKPIQTDALYAHLREFGFPEPEGFTPLMNA